uniref:DUF3611 family protein n=1 Tax=Cyanothece sp. (strain PCC 7425 / ATCC 29141) TaxID=395961 RepID=B8HRC8_CYAP4
MSYPKGFAEALPPELQRLATDLRRIGWIGFWIQVVLGFVSAIIVLLVLFNRQFNLNQVGQRSSVGLFLASVGLAILGVAIASAWRYPQLGRKLRHSRSSISLDRINRSLKMGLMSNIIGMIVTVIAAEWNVGMLLLKVLTVPQGAAFVQPSSSNLLIAPLDILVLQAKVNTIAAQLVGIILAVWLLHRLNQCFSRDY